MISKGRFRSLMTSEDWWACWFGILLFAVSSLGIISVAPRPGIWSLNPLDALSLEIMQSYFFFIVILAMMSMLGGSEGNATVLMAVLVYILIPVSEMAIIVLIDAQQPEM